MRNRRRRRGLRVLQAGLVVEQEIVRLGYRHPMLFVRRLHSGRTTPQAFLGLIIKFFEDGIGSVSDDSISRTCRRSWGV